MIMRYIVILLLAFYISACSKKEDFNYKPTENLDPFILYKEGIEAFNRNDYFYASKKFSEAELNFKTIDLAAKSSIMSSYALYGINFYDQALENLERFLKIYPADKNVIYAHYLESLIYYEQISDEKKDIQPLLDASKKIDFFIKKYPKSDYAIDLKFKKDLIENQLAAKELYVAKYYISTKKWVPAINRLKIIMNKYDKTIFIEEALHRLVEIHYYLGLENEAKKYAKILGYNYNSSEWFEKSYKIFNRDYDSNIKNSAKKQKKSEKSVIKRILGIIK